MNKYQEALTLLFCTSQSLPEQKVYECKKVLQELVDKETPMKAVEQWEDLNSCEQYYKCPKCKLIVSRMCLYCPFCGQKLDWSEE